MSIKILGGFARGQQLAVAKGDTVRPTSIMLRRRIYDYFQDLSGCIFVDLCAGSGAMGFEAWSRGASKIYLNEISKHAMKSLQDNREDLLLRNHHKKSGEIICSQGPAEKFIKHFKTIYSTFSEEQKEETILFLDPPYSQRKVYLDVLMEILGSTSEEAWFFGQLWIESDPDKGFSSSTWSEYNLATAKLFEQGESYIFVTNFPQSMKV